MRDILVIHPRVTGSLLFRPEDMILWNDEEVEAERPTYENESADFENYGTTLEFLLQYDYRGSNPFQEQENLGFLRLWLDRYPEVRHHFREDILTPQTYVRDIS